MLWWERRWCSIIVPIVIGNVVHIRVGRNIACEGCWRIRRLCGRMRVREHIIDFLVVPMDISTFDVHPLGSKPQWGAPCKKRQGCEQGQRQYASRCHWPRKHANTAQIGRMRSCINQVMLKLMLLLSILNWLQSTPRPIMSFHHRPYQRWCVNVSRCHILSYLPSYLLPCRRCLPVGHVSPVIFVHKYIK